MLTFSNRVNANISINLKRPKNVTIIFAQAAVHGSLECLHWILENHDAANIPDSKIKSQVFVRIIIETVI